MELRMKLWNKEGDSRKNMMMLYLMAAGIMEFLFITLESQLSYLGYYLTEHYLIVPALLFLGCALAGQLSGLARKRLLLSAATIGWFVMAQIIHKLSGMDTHPIATVFFVYLMAFPFASTAEDSDNAGLRWIGGMFLVAAMVLVCYAGLLQADMVPERLQQYIFWDGARLHVFWHPNISACFLMIGIGFAVVFLLRTKNLLFKGLLALSVAAQLAVMAMTNCRTTLLMTGAMLGAVLLLILLQRFMPRISRKPGKKKTKVILCVLLVLVILIGVFLLAGQMYRRNNDRLVSEMDGEAVVQDGTGILQGENTQGTLANDMRSLNGRTYVWVGALAALRDSKSLLLFGTEYAGMAISAYYGLDVVHSHNSWMEALLRLGLPGLLLSLVFTVLAVRCAAKLVLNPAVELWKKVLAMLTVCLMAAGFLEPYLFITNVYYHVTDFAFFFLTGYLDYWVNGMPKAEN